MQRATHYTAIGKKDGAKGASVSAKDQAAHKALKFRENVVQTSSLSSNSGTSTSRDAIRMALEEKEAKELNNQKGGSVVKTSEESSVNVVRLLMNKPEVSSDVLKKYDDEDAVNEDEEDSDKDLESSDDDVDDDDDDELELQMELDKIKAERAAAQARKEREERDERDRALQNSAMRGNPLMSLGAVDADDSTMKRKWNDDVVFRNQGKTEPVKKKRFINDTIRNDFHRQFLKKYIR